MKNDPLAQLKALNLAANPYQEARELICQLQKIEVTECTLHAGKTITRARTNELASGRCASFNSTTDLSYKPQQYNDKYQRASTPRRTVFYGAVLPPQADMSIPNQVDTFLPERIIAASEASILLREAHSPNTSQELQQEGITLGYWLVTEDIRLLAVCTHNNLLCKELYEAPALGIAQLSAQLREQSLAANAFFAEEFGKPSHNFANDYEYLISAVFTEIAVDSGFAGVYYPSVKAGENGFNVAISPEYATKALQLDRVLECTLYKQDGKFELKEDKFCCVSPGAATFKLQPIKQGS